MDLNPEATPTVDFAKLHFKTQFFQLFSEIKACALKL